MFRCTCLSLFIRVDRLDTLRYVDAHFIPSVASAALGIRQIKSISTRIVYSSVVRCLSYLYLFVSLSLSLSLSVSLFVHLCLSLSFFLFLCLTLCLVLSLFLCLCSLLISLSLYLFLSLSLSLSLYEPFVVSALLPIALLQS